MDKITQSNHLPVKSDGVTKIVINNIIDKSFNKILFIHFVKEIIKKINNSKYTKYLPTDDEWIIKLAHKHYNNYKEKQQQEQKQNIISYKSYFDKIEEINNNNNNNKNENCCSKSEFLVDNSNALQTCSNCGFCKKYVNEPIYFRNNTLYKEQHNSFMAYPGKYKKLNRLNIWLNHNHQNKQAEIYYNDIDNICKKYKIMHKHVEEIKYVYKDYYIENNINIPKVLDKKTGKMKDKIGPSRGKIRIALYIISIIIIIRKYELYKHIKYLDLINDNNITITNFNNAIKKVKNINLIINKNIIKQINKIKKIFNIDINSNKLIEIYSKILNNLSKRKNTNNVLYCSIYILLKDKIELSFFLNHIKISPKRLSELLQLYNKII